MRIIMQHTIQHGDVLQSRTGWSFRVTYSRSAMLWTATGTRTIMGIDRITEEQFRTRAELVEYLQSYGCGVWTTNGALLR